MHSLLDSFVSFASDVQNSIDAIPHERDNASDDLARMRAAKEYKMSRATPEYVRLKAASDAGSFEERNRIDARIEANREASEARLQAAYAVELPKEILDFMGEQTYGNSDRRRMLDAMTVIAAEMYQQGLEAQG